jgi:HK97 gp10 family phage protein
MARESVRIEGLDAVVKTLRDLPPELVSKRGGPVRVALQKAAKRIQQDEQANLQQIIDTPNIGEEVSESSGLLKKNVVVKRGRLAGGEKGELYAVKVRNKAYPTTKGKRVTTAQVARQLEQGTEKRVPMPFIRPAFDAAKGYVFGMFTAELRSRLDGIVKKLHRTNGGKS